MRSSRLFERIADNWPAKILSVAAAVLLFFFYRISTLEQRYFTVPLEVMENDYYTPSSALPESVRVTLRGKANTIFGIPEGDVNAYVDLTAYSGPGIYRVPIEIRKKGTALDADVEISVEPIALQVNLEKVVQKSVPVLANIKGFPASGYELGQYLLTPNQVTIEGPRSRIDATANVTTAPIDIAGRTTDFTVRVPLQAPERTIRLVGNESVEFHGLVQPIIIIRTIEPIDVITLDLSPALRLRADVTTGSVRIQGNQLTVEKLKPGDITLTVDCSRIHGPGLYILPVKPSVPPGINVLGFSPEAVTLSITSGGAEQ